MTHDDAESGITEEDVRALARAAGLIPGTDNAALARALEADLRLIRALRVADAGETYPAGVAPLPREHNDA